MKKIMLTWAAILLGWVCRGESLVLAPPFTDHAVLQRDVPVPVWGEARPGAQVTVRFDRFENTVVCGEDGKWMVWLPTQTAGFEPRELSVSSDGEEIRCQNILVGEVWFASGQSNMDFRVRANVNNMEQEIATADWPAIRFFKSPQTSCFAPMDDVPDSQWNVCTPESIGDCSAVTYFFARDIHQKE